jgi:hypothetical protein
MVEELINRNQNFEINEISSSFKNGYREHAQCCCYNIRRFIKLKISIAFVFLKISLSVKVSSALSDGTTIAATVN